MKEESPPDVQAYTDIPEEFYKNISPAGTNISIEMPKLRSGLSHHSKLSEYQTSLSQKRTGLSIKRTGMSGRRTSLAELRSHMANERTFLAQTRTAVALMSFGVTLNRFSIYLQENERVPVYTDGRALSALRDVQHIGSGMVVVGIAILLWSLYRYRRVRHEIETLNFKTPELALLIITFFIVLLGAASAVWMIGG